jgi:DNA repair exonuclease SbcCD nuclease subunit
VKRVIISDLHLHPWSYGAGLTPEGYNTRLWAQRQALDEVISYVRKNHVRYVYFCGDLFHVAGKIDTQAFMVAMYFFQAIRDSGCKIRAIAGNHDLVGRSGFIHTLAGLQAHEFTCTERIWDDDEGLRVFGLSYTEDEETLKAFLGKAGDGEGGLVLLHQGVSGLPLASGYVIDERLTPAMIPDTCDAFTGHYHFHKKVSSTLTVVGNLTALGWGDIDLTQGFVVFEDDTQESKQIPTTSAPRFVSFPGGRFEGNFVRWTEPVRLEEQDSIRASCLEQGALAVEFPNVQVDVAVTSSLKCGEEITVEHVLETFQDKDMEPRRVAVGEEIRGEKYETP